MHTLRTLGDGSRFGENMMRSPQGGLSVGNGRLKVGTCPRRGSNPRKGSFQGRTAAGLGSKSTGW